MNVLATTYRHPEAHGPLLSLILSLSENSNKVYFYYKNNFHLAYKFSNNVNFIPNSFKILPEEKLFKSNKLFKLLHFLKFTIKLIKLRTNNTYDLIFIIESIALAAFYISTFFCIKKIKTWYHNYGPIYNKSYLSFFLLHIFLFILIIYVIKK